jgi:hypothetical protein
MSTLAASLVALLIASLPAAHPIALTLVRVDSVTIILALALGLAISPAVL